MFKTTIITLASMFLLAYGKNNGVNMDAIVITLLTESILYCVGKTTQYI